ncbi:tetratricopeptide repeat protein [Undibacterium sp. LX40W]|uniref:Tetratricopeptide repeat protein n=1 Tax=Undibacterium nitidum TaxID=2762298 RepID=A0A923HQD0_9BURK|nr:MULTISPECIES: tetratricopeptide repeat protein [Undibacterium]MBC3882643.1 tetratricopeptide repeat protein [Undibacterium nitidum]MBC3892924.1 tetratricopeptide repeat protein [Undibacterium sp. LX40W]
MRKLLSKLFGQAADKKVEANVTNSPSPQNDQAERKQKANLAIEQGDFNTAASLLKEAIADESENVDLYTNLGFCLMQQGKIPETEPVLREALRLNPSHIDAHFMLASVLAHQNKLDDAIFEYQRVLELNAGFIYAYKDLAALYMRRQEIDQALEVLDKGINQSQDFIDLHYIKAEIHSNQNQLPQAISSYLHVLRLNPDFSAATLQLAAVYERNAEIEKAIEILSQLHHKQNTDIPTLLHLGRLEMMTKRDKEALVHFEMVVKLDPSSVEGLANYGVMLQADRKLEEALKQYDAALAINPQLAPLWHNKGKIAYDQKRFEDSSQFIRRALELSPHNADAIHHLGIALAGLERYEEAIAQFDLALSLNPQHAFSYFDRGRNYLRLEQYEEALIDLKRAVEIDPQFPEANFELGFANLALGNLEAGFKGYEWRWRCSPLKERLRPFSKPQWQGQRDIQGKTILLYGEQGLGDMIQLIRYVTEVANLGARVILEIHAPLIRLFEKFPGVAEIYKAGDILPSYDLRAPIMSLPYLFKTNLETIPFKENYFDSKQLQQAAKHDWSADIKPSARKKIGVTWAGNRDFMHDRKRSVPFTMFSSIFSQDADFYCLQKELSDQDLEQLKTFPNIPFLGAKLTDMLETAALISHLDLVITVDTSIAHLAGAMGKEVWIMLPFNPDWRWLLKRKDSPWYAHARLFRQATIYDWAGVTQEIKHQLSECLQSKS